MSNPSSSTLIPSVICPPSPSLPPVQVVSWAGLGLILSSLLHVPVDEELSETEAEAVAGLLFTKCVVFHPDDLLRAGVRLTEVEQAAGAVVVGDGDVVHFGMTTISDPPNEQTAGRSVNEAVNIAHQQFSV